MSDTDYVIHVAAYVTIGLLICLAVFALFCFVEIFLTVAAVFRTQKKINKLRREQDEKAKVDSA